MVQPRFPFPLQKSKDPGRTSIHAGGLIQDLQGGDSADTRVHRLVFNGRRATEAKPQQIDGKRNSNRL